MKQVSLSERQMNVLMNLGRALDAALIEFRGKTVSEVATVAHTAYSSMIALQMPTITAPVMAGTAVVRKRAKRSKKTKKSTAKTVKTASSSDKTISILSVLNRSKKLIPASEISSKTGIPGQGLGPTLNMMFGNGDIVKKAVDGDIMWGPKALNGKAAHAN
jgi:hypothetical protein